MPKELFQYKRSIPELITQLKINFPGSIGVDGKVDADKMAGYISDILSRLVTEEIKDEDEEKLELIFESFYALGLYAGSRSGRVIMATNINNHCVGIDSYKIFRPVLKYYLNSGDDLELPLKTLMKYAIGVIVDKDGNPDDVELLIEYCKKHEISTHEIFAIIPRDGSNSNLIGFLIGKFIEPGADLEKLLKIVKLSIEASKDHLDEEDHEELTALAKTASLLIKSLDETSPKPELTPYAIRIIATLLINGADIEKVKHIRPEVIKIIRSIEKDIKNYKIETMVQI